MLRTRVGKLLLNGILLGFGKFALADVYMFTTLDIPGVTEVNGINNSGQIVGTFETASPLPTPPEIHGFLDTRGTLTTIDVPGGIPGTTGARGINNKGQIVGFYTGTYDGATGQFGFLDTGGVFTTIAPPGAIQSVVEGINDSGAMVGSYIDASGHLRSFLDQSGILTTINVPGAVPGSTEATGINDKGQIVGIYQVATGSMPFVGFVDVGGIFTTLTPPPGASFAAFPGLLSLGINDSGQIVGSMSGLIPSLMPPASSGFVYSGGVFTPVFDPNATSFGDTSASGINDNGQIVGLFEIGNSNGTLVGDFGFVATCATPAVGCTSPIPPSSIPEPRTLPVLAVCLSALAIGLRRNLKPAHKS
jgi:uncharacterized membrane protein